MKNPGSLTRWWMLGVPKIALIAACCGLLSLDAGCATNRRHDETKAHFERIPLSESQRTGLALDIQNDRGLVEVIVDRLRTDATIEWRAFPADGRPMKPLPDAAANAERGLVAWDMAEDGAMPVLRVLAIQPTGGNASSPVRLRVTLPSCAGVRVRNSGGAVTLRGVSGAIDVNNGYGGGPGGFVNVTTAGAARHPITLLTTEGDIRLDVGPGSTGKIEASAAGGRVRVDASGAHLMDAKAGNREYVGTLGGENAIEIHTARGSVELMVRK